MVLVVEGSLCINDDTLARSRTFLAERFPFAIQDFASAKETAPTSLGFDCRASLNRFPISCPSGSLADLEAWSRLIGVLVDPKMRLTDRAVL